MGNFKLGHYQNPQQQDFWNSHDRIMVRKGDYSFPLQFMEKYFYLQIVILFKQLEIPIPEDHQRCFDQHMALVELKKKRGRENNFNEESGK